MILKVWSDRTADFRLGLFSYEIKVDANQVCGGQAQVKTQLGVLKRVQIEQNICVYAKNKEFNFWNVHGGKTRNLRNQQDLFSGTPETRVNKNNKNKTVKW